MTGEQQCTERIYARYWIETAYPLDDAAAIMAGEQSTGTFVRVPGETDELRERYAARVEQIARARHGRCAIARRLRPAEEAHGPRGAAHRRSHALLADRKHGPIACPICSPPSLEISSS